MGRRARVWLTVALALSMVAGQLPSYLLGSATGASAAGGSISGRVFDATGTSIPGFPVRAEPTEGTTLTALTNSDGTYTFTGLPNDSYLIVFDPGALSSAPPQVYNDKISALTGDRVLVNADSQTHIGKDAHFHTGATLSGTVRNADGSPLSGVQVDAYVGEDGALSRCCFKVRSTTTATNGTYSMNLDPRATYRIRFAAGQPYEQWLGGPAHPPADLFTGWGSAKSVTVSTPGHCATFTGDPTAFDNWNTGGVGDNGQQPTFTTIADLCLRSIDTYHYNSNRGKVPGTITLEGFGQLGPYRAFGSGAPGLPPPSSGGTPWLNWTAGPEVAAFMHAGTWTCIDSDQASWSQDARSGGFGFCRVHVEPYVAPLAQLTGQDMTFDTHPRIAYIYDTDITTGHSYKALLDAHGWLTDLLTPDEALVTNLHSYLKVIVGPDTGSGPTWGDIGGVHGRAVDGSARPIVALGYGGSSFLEQIGSGIGWQQSWLVTDPAFCPACAGVGVVDRADAVWTTPNRILIGEVGVTVYNAFSTQVALFAPTALAAVTRVGREPVTSDANHYTLVRQGRYFLWGFNGGPLAMSSAGKNLFLNVIGPAPVRSVVSSITGIAQCGTGVLSSAKVELLSGNTVVATTTADEGGGYTFAAVAPNTAFTVRYTSADGLIVCVTGVTTGGAGTPTVAPVPQIPSLGNSTWPTAFRLNTEGAPQQDYIAVRRDAWFKVTIGPSEQVVVSLRNCTFDCSLVLYTDIAQAAAELKAQSIASGQKQIAPAELSPAELSPAELSPAELSPAELSPAELSPAELSPAELSPAELSPAELSPAELSPAELSPAELSALAYSSAQTRAILAVSAHAGLSPELIVRNTWEHTGDFYIRALSHDGTTSTQPFTISARVLPGACVGVNLTKTPSLLTASAATSIILTNTSRLTNSAATATAAAMTVAEFTTRLDQFATNNGATVIDLAQDLGIQANYANWDAHPGCALAANTVADSIHDLIGSYRALGGLKYITIAGSDRVVPFRRVPDLAGLGNESTYHVPVLDASQSQAALHSGYFLSQDFYASPAPILRGNLRIDLAQEAIGRIVESLSDMTAMLNAYDGAGGVAKPKTAVSTGYDFIADLANQLKTTFQAEGLTVDTLIEAAGLKSTDPSAWTADQLRSFLFGAKAYGIYAINGHFSGNRALAADYATLIDSLEVATLPASDTRYLNALILSMGCHAAYNIVDGDAIPNATQSVGWVEAFNGRGATVVGSTGYGYADTDFVQYSELVLSKTATALGIGPVPVAIGDALRDAKSSYLSSLAAPEGIDAKAAAEATVYGLPMMKFDVARPSTATGEVPLTLSNGTSSELQYGTPVLSYVLNPHTQPGVPVAGSTTTVPLTYYDASGDIQVSPLQPVLPRSVTRLGLPADAVLRGGALLDARYTEVSPIFPRTDAATTETRGQLPTAFASVFTPLRLFALNQVSDRSLVVLPLQYLTDGVTGTARLYDAQNLHLRLYTSTRTDASALAAAPSISNVILTPVTGGVHVDAIIGGLTAAGLEDVLFTYTNGPVAGVGTWQSLSLRDHQLAADRRAELGEGFSEHVSGDILTGTPGELRLFVQAVSGNAQVSVSSNIGAYFRLAPPTSATSTAPKHPTTLAFTVAPAVSTTYGGSISATVRLSDGTTPLAGKPVAFEFGGHRVRVMTTAGGLATAHFAASFEPTGFPTLHPYALTAAFAEDQDLLGSALSADVAITRAASSLTSAAVTYSNSAMLGATLSANGRTLREELVMITITHGTTVVATRPVLTDGTGRAQTDVASLPDPGTTPYAARFDYAGSDFYGPSAAALSFTSTPSVTGAGNIGGDRKTSFELDARFTRQDGDNGDQHGNNNGRRGDIGPRGNRGENGATVQKPVYDLNGGFQFRSRTAHVKLDSSSFQWLTVVGGRAELQGTGTMENSEAVWQFRLVVVDGSPDTFELSIWDSTGSLATPTFHVGPATVTGQIRIR